MEEDRLNHWLKEIFLALYAWNAGPVDRNDIAKSVVDIGRELPFPIDLSEAWSRKGNSEEYQVLEYFDAASSLMLIQREMFSMASA